MTTVLGYELEHAVSILKCEGYSVNCIDYASKKGVKGNEKRVIRQKLTDENNRIVELVYSVFKTDVNYKEE